MRSSGCVFYCALSHLSAQHLSHTIPHFSTESTVLFGQLPCLVIISAVWGVAGPSGQPSGHMRVRQGYHASNYENRIKCLIYSFPDQLIKTEKSTRFALLQITIRLQPSYLCWSSWCRGRTNPLALSPILTNGHYPTTKRTNTN